MAIFKECKDNLKNLQNVLINRLKEHFKEFKDNDKEKNKLDLF